VKYLIMIQSNPAVGELFAAMTAEERADAYRVYWEVESDLEASGELVDSKAADEDTQEVVMRGPDGPVVSPAPRSDVGDVVSGYYLVDVPSIERAREIAARFPEAAVAGGIRLARTLTQEDFDALGL
jgi:hypothetical protein